MKILKGKIVLVNAQGQRKLGRIMGVLPDTLTFSVVFEDDQIAAFPLDDLFVLKNSLALYREILANVKSLPTQTLKFLLRLNLAQDHWDSENLIDACQDITHDPDCCRYAFIPLHDYLLHALTCTRHAIA